MIYIYIYVVLGDKHGKTLALLEFDGTGSNRENWFHKSRLLYSSWDDLNKKSRTNFFNMRGYLVFTTCFYDM